MEVCNRVASHLHYELSMHACTCMRQGHGVHAWMAYMQPAANLWVLLLPM